MDINRDKGHDGVCPGGHKADGEGPEEGPERQELDRFWASPWIAAWRAMESSTGVVLQWAKPSPGCCLMEALFKLNTMN